MRWDEEYYPVGGQSRRRDRTRKDGIVIRVRFSAAAVGGTDGVVGGVVAITYLDNGGLYIRRAPAVAIIGAAQ